MSASPQPSQPQQQQPAAAQQPGQPQQQPTQPGAAGQASSGAPPAGATPYTSASLYVGDLAPDVTEALLFEIFNAVGPVQSVRVCRDVTTRRSLGYSYVNFHRLEDAERALDTLNFKSIRNRPCRIMWSHRDPTLRKTGKGNIFVKGLAQTIDNKQLYDTFSMFGNILSCKVVQDAKKDSLGYGFVHYEDEEAAQNAITRVDGKTIAGSKVNVQAFKPREERSSGAGQAGTFTNVFAKNLPGDLSQQQFDDMFKKYGTITSSVIQRAKKPSSSSPEPAAADSAEKAAAASESKDTDEEKTENKEGGEAAAAKSEKSKLTSFGFINYEHSEDAQAAIDGLNGTELQGFTIYVGRAQRREERDRELRDHFEQLKVEKAKKYAGVNLYVKNLGDEIDDAKLAAEFGQFGQITSAKVMKDAAGKTRGFGFVCFAQPEEATKAVTVMNGQMLEGKPLYVALAQRKDQRRQQLEAQYAQRAKMGFGPAAMGGMAMQGGMYGQFPGGQQFPFFQQQGFPGQQRFGPGQMPGFPGQQQQQFPGQRPGQAFPQQPFPGQQGQMPYAMLPQAVQGRGGMGGAMGMNGMAGRGGAMAGRGGRGGAQMGMMPGRNGAGMQQMPGQQQMRYNGPMGQSYPQQMPGYPPMQQQQGAMGQQPGIRYNDNVRNRQGPMGQGQLPMGAGLPGQQDSGVLPSGLDQQQQPLTIKELAAAPEEQRKQMIGERLFPLVKQREDLLAGKITGMLLEMDNGELLHLLESQPSLNEKIDEALTVLQQHSEEAEAEEEQQ